MAMAFWGKNKHYLHKDIQKRHLITTAQACGLKHDVNDLLEEIIAQAPQAFAQVQTQLPAGFQIQVLDKTFMGIQATLKKLE
jgi:serine/threonine-protein kinase HipA